MNSTEIRQRFLEFFKRRGHAILPSASLVPENDPSVLFTTAGMQPLVPYLLGEKHPQGKRLANVQKCVRLTDIDEVGDTTHDTFFEMLGNWSLGDYFKKESIEWSFEFLISKEHGLGIDPNKIYVSVFVGDKDSPRDEESIKVWKEVYAKAGIDARVYGEDAFATKKGLKSSYRIFLLGKEDNWWPSGGKNPGPQGPDTEIFYYWGEGEPDLSKERVGFNDDNFWEIWNNVFMEYNRREKGYEKLSQKNVDTGMGLERVAAVLQNQPDVFLSDLYAPIIKILECESNHEYGQNPVITRAMRIIADHLRTAIFILGDDARVTPSNLGKGYVLRRLIRRSLRYLKILEIVDGENRNFLEQLARTVVENYARIYEELGRNFNYILEELKKEGARFENTLEKGLKEWEKLSKNKEISGKDAFNLFSTYGFPLELTEELAQEKGISVDKGGFQKAFAEHQKISRNGAERRFKGGLIDSSYETTKLHTATHLLQAALRAVLGPEVLQRGSNITPERLRFDFSYGEKLTDKEKQRVEELVNNAIKSHLSIAVSEMNYEEAIVQGAIGVFEKKYGDKVKVYTVGNPEQPFSREICGGPHAKNTNELGKFKIVKEEAISAGVRRVKAVLTDD